MRAPATKDGEIGLISHWPEVGQSRHNSIEWHKSHLYSYIFLLKEVMAMKPWVEITAIYKHMYSNTKCVIPKGHVLKETNILHVQIYRGED